VLVGVGVNRATNGGGHARGAESLHHHSAEGIEPDPVPQLAPRCGSG
jgi:hypothetical protein